ncbi:MAG: hypothetical protein RLY93_01500 [Sumerlaeia bacterium]
MTRQDQLHYLSIAHIVAGALTLICGSLPLLHVALGLAMVVAPETMTGNNPNVEPPPAFMGVFFVGFGLVAVALAWAMGLAMLFSGKFMRERRHHMFCFIVSILMCLNMPIGTIIGVLSLMCLIDDETKAEFDYPGPGGPPRPPATGGPARQW